MLIYFDTSALLKCYVNEPGALETRQLAAQAAQIGIVAVGKAEAAAALSKAQRMGKLPPDAVESVWRAVCRDWSALVCLQINDALVNRAADLALLHGLRGYDALHLAGALIWQEALREPVWLATFDRQLWRAARDLGLPVWPESEP